MCDISYWYRCQTLQLFTVYQLKCTSGKTVIFPHVEMWLGNKCSGVLLHYVWQWMMILNKAASEWTCINSRTSVVTLSQSPPQEPTQQRRFFSKWTERGTPDGRQKPTCQVVLLFFFSFSLLLLLWLTEAVETTHLMKKDDLVPAMLRGESEVSVMSRWLGLFSLITVGLTEQIGQR